MSTSGIEAMVSDYFSRLKRALAPLPRNRRSQLLDDLREHVATARADLTEESEASVREILDHLGLPADIAAEALAGAGRPRAGWRAGWRVSPGRSRKRTAITAAVAAVALAAGGTTGVVLASSSAAPAAAMTDSLTVANAAVANSDCSPATDAATSGGPAATLASKATEVASGTVAGQRWSLWSAHGHSGATGLEDGGLVIGGHAYGLCPGFPNPAELEMADIGSAALVYGVIGYPRLAKVSLYVGSTGTFDRGAALPSPAVRVVDGVSFFVGELSRSACDYRSLELNSAAREGSSQHNLGFGSCVIGRLVQITESMGAWSVG
jgi:hypothetical protein